jgi:hypothetical protein
VGVSKSFRTSRLERELQMVQLSATKCSCIAILLVSLVSFAAIILRVASQRAIPKVSVYFVIDSVRKLLDTPSYILMLEWESQHSKTDSRLNMVSQCYFSCCTEILQQSRLLLLTLLSHKNSGCRINWEALLSLWKFSQHPCLFIRSRLKKG